MTDDSLLGVYLNDHLAGSAGGVALARRIARSHRGTSDAPTLEQFAKDVAEDRDSLIAIMTSLGLGRTYYKEAAAVVGERLGRLKLNGRVVSRSPLSSLVELEMMALGVTGKRSGWRTLRELSETDARLDRRRLDQLLERAEAQLELLEQLRVKAAASALGQHGNQVVQ